MAQYDLKLFGGGLIITDVVDAAIQELDILFGTENTELIGDTSYGVNFENFLWKLNPNPGEVREYLNDKIRTHTYYCNRLTTEINVDITAGTLRDIYTVKIDIKDSDGESVKVKNYILK